VLRAWIDQVLSSRGWSARQWALAAGISPTTLTRLINNKEASLPTSEALARLSRAAGSQPMFLPTPVHAGLSWVPILSRALLNAYVSGVAAVQQSTVDAARSSGAVVPVVYKPSNLAVAVELTADTGAARGLTAGSFVICEPEGMIPLHDGKIVAAIVGHDVGAWLYQAPYLLPMTTEPGVPVLLDDAKIIGTVVAQHRTKF
jgi:hypothetical protein